MKKLIYCAAALAAMIFAGSCQRENLEPVAQENTVTYTVELPGAETKAIADGSNVDRLYYEVWKFETKEKDLAKLTTKDYATRLYQKDIAMTSENGAPAKTVVTLNLVQDQEYTILFWAQNNNALGTDTPAYNTANLTAVTYAADILTGKKTPANNENLAAFYAVEFVSDGDPRSKTVYLKRPFAQLNIGTLNTVKKEEYTINMKESKVKVSSVPTVFNVATSVASGEVEDFVFDTAILPNNPEHAEYATDAILPVGGVNYQYVAMNYIFANHLTDNGQSPAAVNVEFDINVDLVPTAANAATTTAIINHEVPNVPLSQNYRTNIVGNLLTSTTEYEVIVDKSWAGDDLAPDPLYMAVALGGEVTLTHDYDLPNPLVIKKDLKINLNGYTIKGGKDYVANAGMTAADISALTIEEGATLTIEDNGNILGGEYAITVKDGIFNGNGGNYIGTSTGIYVVDGTANITGGTYAVREIDSSGRYFVVNCKDTSWNRGSSKINITGGTYINFNPNEAWESQHTVNFLAEGYTVIPVTTDNGTEYTVVSGATITTTDEFKAAAQNPSLEYIIIASDLNFAGEKVILTTDKIILGNGHSFNAGGGNAYAISVQGVEVSLQNLTIIDGGGIQLFNDADVTVKDITVIPNYTQNSRHIFYVNNSNLTVESGSFEITRTKSIYLASEGDSDILIKGGVWADMVSSGYAPVSIGDGGNFSIIGGSFQVNVSSYKFDPTPYLADGYTTVRDGNYMVVIPE
jgi:hypothetical protein